MKKVIAILSVVLLLIFSGCSTLQKNDAQESSVPDEVRTSSSTDEPESSDEETTPLTQKLVVPEGFTIAKIGMRLEKMGVCTTDEFLEAAQTGDFSEFPLVAQQEPNPNRCYNLEGYLFPDTYEIYSDESPDYIIRRMLANNENKYNGEMRSAIAESGYTVDEIITVASIIQKEAYERNESPVPQEMPRIASVLYNRLDSGMMLQCNVTATYVNGVLKEFVDDGFDKYNEYYNTYHCPALPAGAICNPGLDSIKAAIYPTETDYLFFLTDDDKNFYYSATYEEHLVLVEEHLGKEG